LSGNDARQP